MNLRKLQIFVRVASLGSFSKAARELHMAQPAVSIAIQKLEESLGAQLLDRSGRKVAATAEGEVLLAKAESILHQIESLKSSIGSMGALESGEITLACPSMLATYYLPDLLSGFLAIHPGLKAAVTQAGTERVEELLLNNEIEIGITTTSAIAQSAELEVIPLVREQMVLCIPESHPWVDRKSVNVSELDQVPMVLYESGYFIRNRFDQLCAAQQLTPDIRMQTNFLPLIIKMVKEGLGSTIGLEIMAREEPGLVGIPIEPATPVNMALAKRSDRPISRANQEFMDWAASGQTPLAKNSV